MNVVMYVMNDLGHDARVQREARSLMAAGHAVTVMATTTGPDQPTGTRRTENGIDVIHVAVPRRYPWWFVWLKHPWRIAVRAAGELRSSPRRPARIPVALGLTAFTIVSIPWMIVRAAWDGFSRAVLG
ncbi:MAG TPA: hypothetical protein VFP22_08945, partial [Candidatus Limnocylindrales bacterium]|nr:hypothetical protein [Candidatus Limnocylindrales bacterium]